MTSIGDLAFENCEVLTSVTIGSGVSEIGGYAFSLCPKLADVTCLAEKVPSTHAHAFNSSYPDKATLHVPAGAIEAYRVAEPWNRFMSILAIEEGGTDLAKYDASGDGKTDAADVAALADRLAGSAPAGFNEAAADVNYDGKVDIADIVALVNLLLGK